MCGLKHLSNVTYYKITTTAYIYMTGSRSTCPLFFAGYNFSAPQSSKPIISTNYSIIFTWKHLTKQLS